VLEKRQPACEFVTRVQSSWKGAFSISGMNVVSRLGSPAHMLPLIALIVVCDEIKNTSVVE
jgi:hypothetical protein